MHGARRAPGFAVFRTHASLQRTLSGRDWAGRDWTYSRHEFCCRRDSGSELLASFWCDYSGWEEPVRKSLVAMIFRSGGSARLVHRPPPYLPHRN
jgi:hypothetical protein